MKCRGGQSGAQQSARQTGAKENGTHSTYPPRTSRRGICMAVFPQQSSHNKSETMVLEKLQGHLELLEQEFLANKEKHLAMKEQVPKHKCPAAKDFDPERKVDSEIFKLETPLKDFKEKINKSKCTSAVSLPMNSPINLDDLSFISSPPLNEEEPSTASGRQDRAETTSASCAFCLRVLQWEQKMEKKDHRGVDCERFPIAIQDKMLHPDSVLGSDTGYSCCSASRIGLQSSKCQNCGTKIHNSQRVCSKEPPKGESNWASSGKQNKTKQGYIWFSVRQTLLHSHPIPTPAGFLKTHPPATLAVTKKRNLRDLLKSEIWKNKSHGLMKFT
ncbi:hypothetical protein JEQ12_000623 [Ovis aries]|uniref:Uncharacterized protein n=1 Tax=Ovis aries TaxID=9940 RepID=A0A836D9S5_SHEEP|nr:hypothetical protein JEQ12_000623 [Ovis aries]